MFCPCSLFLHPTVLLTPIYALVFVDLLSQVWHLQILVLSHLNMWLQFFFFVYIWDSYLVTESVSRNIQNLLLHEKHGPSFPLCSNCTPNPNFHIITVALYEQREDILCSSICFSGFVHIDLK
jgi:hypothetical protein